MELNDSAQKVVETLRNAHKQGRPYLTICEIARRSGVHKWNVSVIVNKKLSHLFEDDILKGPLKDRVTIHHVALKGVKPAHKVARFEHA